MLNKILNNSFGIETLQAAASFAIHVFIIGIWWVINPHVITPELVVIGDLLQGVAVAVVLVTIAIVIYSPKYNAYIALTLGAIISSIWLVVTSQIMWLTGAFVWGVLTVSYSVVTLIALVVLYVKYGKK